MIFFLNNKCYVVLNFEMFIICLEEWIDRRKDLTMCVGINQMGRLLHIDINF